MALVPPVAVVAEATSPMALVPPAAVAEAATSPTALVPPVVAAAAAKSPTGVSFQSASASNVCTNDDGTSSDDGMSTDIRQVTMADADADGTPIDDDDGQCPLKQQRLNLLKCRLEPSLGNDFWENFDEQIEWAGADYENHGDGLNSSSNNEEEMEEEVGTVSDSRAEVLDSRVEASDRRAEASESQAEASESRAEASDSRAEATDSRAEASNSRAEAAVALAALAESFEESSEFLV